MRLRRWLAALTVAAVVLGLFSQALAADQTVNVTVDEAVAALRDYGIVKGDPSGDMRLGDPITRAELVKIVVAAMGREWEATVLKGAPSFVDTQDHWASGYIAVAKNLGLAGGYPDGSFQPQANVTNAEVLAFLIRAVGVDATAGLAWPENVIDAAAKAGIVPPGVSLTTVANVPATRGAVFLLAHRAFLLVRDAQGKNLYMRTVDKDAPVLKVSTVPEVTSEASVTISGTVTGAKSVTIAGRSVPIGAGGAFTTQVSLEFGQNEIPVVAVDEVGNQAVKTITVGRAAGEPASIEAPRSLSLKAGESKVLDIVVKDANGLAIQSPDLEAQVSGDIGTFEPETRTFVASGQTGAGTLTLTAGQARATIAVTVGAGSVAEVRLAVDKESVAVGEMGKVTAKAYDAHGNEVKGLPVIYSASSTAIMLDAQTGDFIGARQGLVTVRATIGTVTGSTQVGVYGSPFDLKLEGPETLVGNDKGVVPFRVLVVDRNGSIVANDEDRTVVLDTDVSELVFVDANGNELVNNRLGVENGQATFYVKADARTWGVIAEITATDEDDDDFEDTFSFEIAEQVAAAVAVVSQDHYVASNAPSTASVKFAVVDQAGVEMLDGTWDIDWSVEGPAEEDETGEESGTYLYIGGDEPVELKVRSLTGRTGTVTVTAESSGLKSATAVLTATLVGDPEKISLSVDKTEHPVGDYIADDGGVEVTVTVTDGKGVPVEYTGDVVIGFSRDFQDIESTDDSLSDLLPEDSNGDDLLLYDKVTVEFNEESRRTFKFLSERAGQYELKATASDLASATATTSFKAGRAATAGFEDKGVLVAVTDNEGEATVQLMDAWGNLVPQAGVSITLKGQKSGSDSDEVVINGRKGSATVKTDENGQAKFSFTVRPDVNAAYSIVVDSAQGLDPSTEKGTLEVKVLPAVPEDLTLTFHRNSDGAQIRSIGAGDPVELRVVAKDHYGFTVAELDDYLQLVVPDGAFDLDNQLPGETSDQIAKESWTYEGDGVYSLLVTPAKIGSQRVTVKLNVSGQSVTESQSLTITPGTAHHVIVREATEADDSTGELTLAEGEMRQVTLVVVDAWNNQVRSGSFEVLLTNSTDIIVRLSPSSPDIRSGDTFSMGVTKTIQLLAPRSDDDGTLSFLLDVSGGSSWDLSITVSE